MFILPVLHWMSECSYWDWLQEIKLVASMGFILMELMLVQGWVSSPLMHSSELISLLEYKKNIHLFPKQIPFSSVMQLYA